MTIRRHLYRSMLLAMGWMSSFVIAADRELEFVRVFHQRAHSQRRVWVSSDLLKPNRYHTEGQLIGLMTRGTDGGFGISLQPYGGTYWISHIQESDSAKVEGLQVRDVILAVSKDGSNYEEGTDFLSFLETVPVNLVHMVVRRGKVRAMSTPSLPFL